MTRAVAHPEWALCLGGADCVWDDVLAWEAEYGREWDGLVIAANDVGCHWPRAIDHWVSLHSNKFGRWEALRKRHQLPGGYARWGMERHAQLVDQHVKVWAAGSSGLLAVQVAWTLGCTRAVLCGIPMTASAHFGESGEGFHKKWFAANAHWSAWSRVEGKLAGWVRSMSGRTRERYGCPSLDWLREAPAAGG